VNRKVEQGQTTRQELVAVARRLFAERGYDATSIETVLEETGISRGALYHHFSSKQALFETVLESVEAEIAQAIVDAAGDITDPVEALHVGSAAWLRFARDPAVRRIALVDAPTAVGWQKWRDIDERHGFGLLKGTLEAAAQAGRIRADAIDALAHMLLAALVEVALVIARADDPEAAGRKGRAAVEALLGSLFAAADPPPPAEGGGRRRGVVGKARGAAPPKTRGAEPRKRRGARPAR
jgi:AcrR family transcriptional regulator